MATSLEDAARRVEKLHSIWMSGDPGERSEYVDKAEVLAILRGEPATVTAKFSLGDVSIHVEVADGGARVVKQVRAGGPHRGHHCMVWRLQPGRGLLPQVVW